MARLGGVGVAPLGATPTPPSLARYSNLEERARAVSLIIRWGDIMVLAEALPLLRYLVVHRCMGAPLARAV